MLLALVLALPVLAVGASWLQWNEVTAQILREMAATVLPEYLWVTVKLTLMVAVGVVAMGVPAALLVTVFDFPGRRTFGTASLKSKLLMKVSDEAKNTCPTTL